MARLARQTGDPVAAQGQALALVDNLVHRQAAILAYNDLAWLFGIMFLATLPLLFSCHVGTEPRQPATWSALNCCPSWPLPVSHHRVSRRSIRIKPGPVPRLRRLVMRLWH